MLAWWVMDEVKTAKLNDRRLNRRLAEVLSQLAAPDRQHSRRVRRSGGDGGCLSFL